MIFFFQFLQDNPALCYVHIMVNVCSLMVCKKELMLTFFLLMLFLYDGVGSAFYFSFRVLLIINLGLFHHLAALVINQCKYEQVAHHRRQMFDH